MNFGQLKTAFENRLKRRDLSASASGEYIQQAIARIQRTLRVPAMEKTVTVEVTESFDPTVGIAIPDDLLGLIELSTADGTLSKKGDDEVIQAAKAQGTPKVFSQRGSYYLVGPYPAVGDELRIDYWAELDTLSANDDDNWLSEIAPDVIIYGALSYAADDFLDRRGDRWEARYLQLKGELEDQAAADELSNGAVSPAHIFPEED